MKWPIVIRIKMSKNFNPNVVVMDRGVFEYYQTCEYIAQREAGPNYLGYDARHVAKHIRRFNPNLLKDL